MRDLLMISSLASLLVVTLAILIALSGGLRRHRIGVTLLASWCSAGVSIYGLRLIGDAISPDLYFSWYGPLGTWFAAWALWDVSRLSRHYGTATIVQAADIARGMLHSPAAEASVWAHWVHGLPTAAWVKGPGGVMVAINRHYEHTYGKPAADYAGAVDGDVWPMSVAESFLGHDAEVYRLGTPVVVQEPTPTWRDPHKKGLILKFPVRDRRGEIVSVGGMEIPDHKTEEVTA